MTCPAAPAGWAAAPTNPHIWGPVQNPGQYSEEVTCSYTSGTKIASVNANFALPSDPNPVSDFDYGCDAKDQAWDASTRIYVVTSRTQWGYAELDDSNRQLAPGDVAAFESATRTLLKNSEGAGHGCKLDTSQTSVLSSFLFSFEYSELGKNFTVFGGVSSGIKGNAMIPAGSFKTTSKSTGSTVLEKVVSVSAPAIPITVVKGNKERTVVLRIYRGIDFFIRSPLERLRLDVRVVQSNYPTCQVGAHGVLTLSTQQFLASTVGPCVNTASALRDALQSGEAESDRADRQLLSVARRPGDSQLSPALLVSHPCCKHPHLPTRVASRYPVDRLPPTGALEVRRRAASPTRHGERESRSSRVARSPRSSTSRSTDRTGAHARPGFPPAGGRWKRDERE